MNILPIRNKPGFWLVPSASGGAPHEVNGRTGSCDCPCYIHRLAGTYQLCRHGKALKAYLDAQKWCPACGGRGAFLTRVGYESGSEPIECVTCGGSGLRETADPALVAVADRFRAQQALQGECR